MLAGAGSRWWIRLDLYATTGQGNAGEQGGTGGVIGIGGDPEALGSRSLAVLEPIGQGRDLGNCVVAPQQFRHGLRWWRSAGAADQQVRWLQRPARKGMLVQHLLPEALGLLQTRRSAIKHHDQISGSA